MVALQYSILEKATPDEIEKGKLTAYQSVFGGGGYTANLNEYEMEWYKAYLEEYTEGQNYNRALVEYNRQIEQQALARQAQQNATTTTLVTLPAEKLAPVTQPSTVMTPSGGVSTAFPDKYQSPTSDNPLGLPEGYSAPKEFYEGIPQPVDNAFISKPAPTVDYYLGIGEPVEERGRLVTMPGESTPTTIPSYELSSDTLTGAAKEATFVGVLPTKPETLGIYTTGAYEADYAESRMARDVYAFQENPLSFKDQPGFTETVTGYSTAEGEMTVTSYGLGEDYFKQTYVDYLKESKAEYQKAPYAIQVKGNLVEYIGTGPKIAIGLGEFVASTYKTIAFNLGGQQIKSGKDVSLFNLNWKPVEFGGYFGEVMGTPGKQATETPWSREWFREAIFERPQTVLPIYGMIGGGALAIEGFASSVSKYGWNTAGGEAINAVSPISYKTGVIKSEFTMRNPFTQIEKGPELTATKLGTINEAPAFTASGESKFLQTGRYDYTIVEPKLFGGPKITSGSINTNVLSKVNLEEGNVFVPIPKGDGFSLYGTGKRNIISSTNEPVILDKYNIGSRPVTTKTTESFRGGGEGLVYDLGEKEISKSISTFYSKLLEKFTIKGSGKDAVMTMEGKAFGEGFRGAPKKVRGTDIYVKRGSIETENEVIELGESFGLTKTGGRTIPTYFKTKTIIPKDELPKIEIGPKQFDMPDDFIKTKRTYTKGEFDYLKMEQVAKQETIKLSTKILTPSTTKMSAINIPKSSLNEGSMFTGLGLYEKTEPSMSFGSISKTFKSPKSSYGDLSIDSNSYGNMFKPLSLDIGNTKSYQPTTLTTREGNMFGDIVKPKQDNILTMRPIEPPGFREFPREIQTPYLAPILKQPQRNELTSDIPFGGRPFGSPKGTPKGFNFDYVNTLIGFPLILPGLGLPDSRPRGRRKGKRKYKRTPSLVSGILGISASQEAFGEETGLVSRPILVRSRRRKR